MFVTKRLNRFIQKFQIHCTLNTESASCHHHANSPPSKGIICRNGFTVASQMLLLLQHSLERKAWSNGISPDDIRGSLALMNKFLRQSSEITPSLFTDSALLCLDPAVSQAINRDICNCHVQGHTSEVAIITCTLRACRGRRRRNKSPPQLDPDNDYSLLQKRLQSESLPGRVHGVPYSRFECT